MHSRGRIRAAVVVLGDLGRSPRMRYHAAAMADSLAEVELIGEAGTALPDDLVRNPHVRCHRLPVSPPAGGNLAGAAGRTAARAAGLARSLLARLGPLDLLLVQSPPALPVLPIAWLAARHHRAPLVVDWHNFGHRLLALPLGESHPAVRGMRALERVFGRGADAHLCVSAAMRRVLFEEWGIDATVFYDRPHEQFTPLPDDRRAEVRAAALDRFGWRGDAAAAPALLVSATSWSRDEDLPLLLEAARLYDRRATSDATLPDLFVVISGEGPLRASFEQRLAGTPLARVHFRCTWLPPAEYPRLLAAADLGLCLHRSASGVDLPMKVADFFGAGLPVCALDYGPCLGEQIRPGENGVLFADDAQLAAVLVELLRGFPGEAHDLARLRDGVRRRATPSWTTGWHAEALPVLRRTLAAESRS